MNDGAFSPDLQTPVAPIDPPFDAPADELFREPAGDLPDPAPDDAPDPSDDLRARLLGQFERWLDGMLGDEPEPPVPPELLHEALAETDTVDPSADNTDLYTLFAALTALTGEIGLQGRTFKQLSDALAPLSQLPAGLEALEEAQHAAARQLADLIEQQAPGDDDDSALPSSKELLGVMFDLLERLERGRKTLESATIALKQNQPRGVFAKLGGTEKQFAQMLSTVEATKEGYGLTLSRLEAALQQWGIQRTGKRGDIFDPKIMTAIEIDAQSDLPDGSVTEVYKSGYSIHGQILALPQVNVARKKVVGC